MKIKSNHFIERPHTRLGWWSFWSMAAFVVMFLINSAVFMAPAFNPPWSHTILPFYGILMMLCGLCAGIGGLFAIIRRRERSWLVWLTLLPGSLVLFLLFGEFLFPY